MGNLTMMHPLYAALLSSTRGSGQLVEICILIITLAHSSLPLADLLL